MSAPAKARRPPAPKAASARGKRSSRITWDAALSSACRRKCTTSPTGIALLPIDSASTSAATAVTPSTSQMRTARARARAPEAPVIARLSIPLSSAVLLMSLQPEADGHVHPRLDVLIGEARRPEGPAFHALEGGGVERPDARALADADFHRASLLRDPHTQHDQALLSFLAC